MTQAPAAIFKIPTESPQPARGKAASRALKLAAAAPKAARRVAGVETRAATRGDGEVIELELGITVYPPRDKGGRWRAVWHEDGERQQCESVSEEKLAGKLEKVRLAARHGRGEHDAARRGPDRLVPQPGPAPGGRTVVTQARVHPAASVPAVRRTGHRRGHLPGHHGQPHAEDRQRRPYRRRGRPGPPDAVRHGRRGPQGRLPRQPHAGRGPLAGRGPPAARPEGHGRGRVGAVGRPRRDPVRRRYRPLGRALAAGPTASGTS